MKKVNLRDCIGICFYIVALTTIIMYSTTDVIMSSELRTIVLTMILVSVGFGSVLLAK